MFARRPFSASQQFCSAADLESSLPSTRWDSRVPSCRRRLLTVHFFFSKQEIQEITLSILIDIMNGAELETLLPYNDPRCRSGLYQLLVKLVLCSSQQWPAPLNYASAVFSSGLNDPNLEVQGFQLM